MALPCKSVLIVEDDSATREVLANALDLQGVMTVPARDAAEAMRVLDGGFQPSVILLDMVLPRVSGLELLPVLRKHRSAVGVPIVGMSASPRELAMANGALDAKIEKPFDLEILCRTLAEVCEGLG